jgi:hypothetical protein
MLHVYYYQIQPTHLGRPFHNPLCLLLLCLPWSTQDLASCCLAVLLPHNRLALGCCRSRQQLHQLQQCGQQWCSKVLMAGLCQGLGSNPGAQASHLCRLHAFTTCVGDSS